MDYYDYIKYNEKSSKYLFEYLKSKYYSGMDHLGLFYILEDKYSTEGNKYICFVIYNNKQKVIISIHFRKNGVMKIYHCGYNPPYSNSEIESGIRGYLSYIYRKKIIDELL